MNKLTTQLSNYLVNGAIDKLSPEAKSEVLEQILSLHSLIEEKLKTSSLHPLEDYLPANIVNPLSRKLIFTFEDLLKFSQKDVEKIHGIGPIKMAILMDQFEKLGYSFKKE